MYPTLRSFVLLVAMGTGLMNDVSLQADHISVSRIHVDTTDTTLVFGKGETVAPRDWLKHGTPLEFGRDTLSIIRPGPVPGLNALRRPLREDCRLDAVDPGMAHEPDTNVVASMGVVPLTRRFEPMIRALHPCQELSEWRSVPPAQ